ncbi:MAG: sugar ABC transporter permease [Candidatus Izimaplasma sp.]|nr:sugar ABC transporter permease [Candidatus Izimaplasma bacterium]
MENIKKTIKKVATKILLLVTTIVILFILPIFFFINIIEKISSKKIIHFDHNKKRGFIGTYAVNYWLGETYKAQNNRVFVYFLFPSLFAFSLFVGLPFLQGVYFSLTDWSGLNDPEYIGFENYKTIFFDYAFGYSFFRTAIYSLLNIVFINIVAFSLALLVTQKLKFKNVYRAGFFMPNLIGGLVLGYIWQFIFNKAFVQFGEQLIEFGKDALIFGSSITRLGEAMDTSILISGNSALFGLILVVTWQYAGYIMMIYIAAINNIPQDLVEASKIDGANAYQRLRTITLPLVAQAFTVAMFLTLVTSFKQFDTVTSLTQGGPAMQLPAWIGSIYNKSLLPIVQSTDLVAINIYDEAFVNRNMGLGQAKAILFFMILLVIALIQVYYNKKKEVEL